jgi:hypothetical protein
MSILQKIKAAWKKIEPYFTEHPATADETYFQHLVFTLKMGFRFIYAGLAILVHGVLPFTFVRTASNEIIRSYRIMRTRVPKSEQIAAEEQENHYHGA